MSGRGTSSQGTPSATTPIAAVPGVPQDVQAEAIAEARSCLTIGTARMAGIGILSSDRVYLHNGVDETTGRTNRIRETTLGGAEAPIRSTCAVRNVGAILAEAGVADYDTVHRLVNDVKRQMGGSVAEETTPDVVIPALERNIGRKPETPATPPRR